MTNLSFDAFAAALQGKSLQELRDLARESGHELEAKRKVAAVEELFQLYLRSEGVGVEPEPEPEPEPVQEPEPEPVVHPDDLVYELRSKSGRTISRHGIVCTPVWRPAPRSLSEAEREDLRRFPHIDIRVKG